MWVRLDGRTIVPWEHGRRTRGTVGGARHDGRRGRAGLPLRPGPMASHPRGGIRTHRSRGRASRPYSHRRSASRTAERRPTAPPRSAIGDSEAPRDALPEPRPCDRRGTVARSGSASRDDRPYGPRPPAPPASSRGIAPPGRVAIGPSIRRSSSCTRRPHTVNTSPAAWHRPRAGEGLETEVFPEASTYPFLPEGRGLPRGVV